MARPRNQVILLQLLRKTTISRRNLLRPPVPKLRAKAIQLVAHFSMAAPVLMEVVPACCVIKSHLTRSKGWSIPIQATRHSRVKRVFSNEPYQILCSISTRTNYVSPATGHISYRSSSPVVSCFIFLLDTNNPKNNPNNSSSFSPNPPQATTVLPKSSKPILSLLASPLSTSRLQTSKTPLVPCRSAAYAPSNSKPNSARINTTPQLNRTASECSLNKSNSKKVVNILLEH